MMKQEAAERRLAEYMAEAGEAMTPYQREIAEWLSKSGPSTAVSVRGRFPYRAKDSFGKLLWARDKIVSALAKGRTVYYVSLNGVQKFSPQKAKGIDKA